MRPVRLPVRDLLLAQVGHTGPPVRAPYSYRRTAQLWSLRQQRGDLCETVHEPTQARRIGAVGKRYPYARGRKGPNPALRCLPTDSKCARKCRRMQASEA